MRRWIALLLMVLLPLQVSWSVAAGYGDHGDHGDHHATIAAPHAELHAQAHAHEGVHGPVHESASAAAPGAGEADSHLACCDLHQCHAHCSFAALTASAGFAALATATGYAAEQAGRLRSFDAARIERPKWAASPITS